MPDNTGVATPWHCGKENGAFEHKHSTIKSITVLPHSALMLITLFV
jgi:hypothetical protein